MSEGIAVLLFGFGAPTLCGLLLAWAAGVFDKDTWK